MPASSSVTSSDSAAKLVLVVALAAHNLQALSLGALVLDPEIAGHRLGAHVQGMAFTRLPVDQHPQSVGGAVELGLIVDDDGRACGRRQRGKPALGRQILSEMRHDD